MANMREIRNRINSVQSTMKITNAMYLMASSKLKKARARLDATAPYFNRIQETITEILQKTPEMNSFYFADYTPPEEELAPKAASGKKKCLYLVITSDKGLAGAYNHNVTKLAESLLDAENENHMMFVGYTGRNYFNKAGTVLIDDRWCYPAVDPEDWRALYLAGHIIELYKKREVDEVTVVYTRMQNAMSSNAEVLPLLPLQRGVFDGKEAAGDTPVFLPSAQAVLEQIIPGYIKGVIFGAMVESFCAEQNARMQAMDNATSNAKDMVKELSLLYNRVRQAAITQEITEVVGGAQAQEG